MSEEVSRKRKAFYWTLIIGILIMISYMPIGPISPDGEGSYMATMPIRFYNDVPCLVTVDISHGWMKWAEEPIPCETIKIPESSHKDTFRKYTSEEKLFLEFTFNNGTSCYIYSIDWEVPYPSAFDIYNCFYNVTVQELIE